MRALAGPHSSGEVMQRTCRGSAAWRQLPAGIGTVAVYRVGDLLFGLPYDGYGLRDQASSGGTIASGRQLEPLPWTST